MTMKKIVVMFVLLLLCSSIFAFAQETTDASGSEPACNLGCKVWQFFFGSKEARAGKAWFDRGALVGRAGGGDILETVQEDVEAEKSKKATTQPEQEGKKEFSVTYVEEEGGVPKSIIVNAETEEQAKFALVNQFAYGCQTCEIINIELANQPTTPAPKTTAPAPTSVKPAVSTPPQGVSSSDHANAAVLHDEAGKLFDAGKYSEALAKENQVILIEPSNYKAHGRKAEILMKMEKYNEAAMSYQKALDDPKISGSAKTQTQERLAIANSLYLKQPAANNQLKSGGVKGTLEGKEGTFTLDQKGEVLSFQQTNGEKKVVHDLYKTQFSSSSPVFSDVFIRATEAQRLLGDTLFRQYGVQFIDYSQIPPPQLTSQGGTVITYPLNRGFGTITAVEDAQGGYVTVTGKINIPNAQGQATDWTMLKRSGVDGQIIAYQTLDQLKQGVMAVGPTGEVVTVGKGVTPNSLRSGKPVYNVEDGEKVGSVQYAEDKLEIVDFNKETQTVFNTKTQEKESLNIDYYQKGESGCTTDGGCKVATGGTATILTNGKLQEYLVDYDYKTSGVDRAKSENLEDKEYFNPSTGRQEGTRLSDGTLIVAQKDENGNYNGEFSVKSAEGEILVKEQFVSSDRKVEGGKLLLSGEKKWVPVSSPSLESAKQSYDNAKKYYDNTIEEFNRISTPQMGGESPTPVDPQSEEYLNAQQAVGLAEQKLKEAEQDLKEEQDKEKQLIDKLNNEKTKEVIGNLASSTTGALAGAQTFFQSVYSITNNLKSYPAISNLLFGEADFYKKWRSDMDKAFAPLLASNWFPSAICENDELHWQDIEPEGKAVIKTTSGTYQAVASIQMERSPETSPILCHKNPDEDSEELFICESRQVCVDDNFCYADNDRDNEPDNNEPLKGYFYKVTWAVSSPQDEAFTPLRDENGVAVSFNVFLYPGAVPMYNLDGNIASPIQLQNGASDKDAIIKYSTNVYDQACIRWNQAPISIGVAGREGETAAGYGAIDDVCFSVVTSSVGQVNWDRSGKSAASVTVSHGEVSKNTDW